MRNTYPEFTCQRARISCAEPDPRQGYALLRSSRTPKRYQHAYGPSRKLAAQRSKLHAPPRAIRLTNRRRPQPLVWCLSLSFSQQDH